MALNNKQWGSYLTQGIPQSNTYQMSELEECRGLIRYYQYSSTCFITRHLLIAIYSIYSSVKHPNLKALLQEHLNKLEKSQPTEVKPNPAVESIKPTIDQPTIVEATAQPEPAKSSVGTATSTTNILPEKRKATIPTTGVYIPIEDFAW